MPNINSQKLAEHDDNHGQRDMSSEHLRFSSTNMSAIERYPATPVRCHLIADRHPTLHSSFNTLIDATSSDIDFLQNRAVDLASIFLLVPVSDDVFARQDVLKDLRLTQASAKNEHLPIVVITEGNSGSRHVGFPPNVVATIPNSPDGAKALRKVIKRFAQRRHQRLWLVGDNGTYLENIFTCLGFDVRSVQHPFQVVGINECMNTRNGAEHIMFASCGPRCYSDYDNFPANIESALDGNDLLSMSVILDEVSMELKAGWESRGASTFILNDIVEEDLVKRATDVLYMQHQIAMLHQDVIRDPESGIYNKTYLDDCGRRLHSMARRGDLFFAVAVVQFRMKSATVDNLEAKALAMIGQYIKAHLREHDIVAQRFPGELVFLITSSAQLELASFLQRLSDEIQDYIDESLDRKPELAIGATAENGINFDAMLHRATIAALQCKMPGSGLIVML